jgi:hypothetical protein
MANLRSRLTRRPARSHKRIFCVAVVTAAGLAGLVTPATASTAASQASLYLSPASGSPSVGDELDVQIRVNTGSQQTNAVQANLTYPSGQLSVLGFDNSTTSFPITAQQQASNGLIQVARGTATPVSGDTQPDHGPVPGDRLIEDDGFSQVAHIRANQRQSHDAAAITHRTVKAFLRRIDAQLVTDLQGGGPRFAQRGEGHALLCQYHASGVASPITSR